MRSSQAPASAPTKSSPFWAWARWRSLPRARSPPRTRRRTEAPSHGAVAAPCVRDPGASLRAPASTKRDKWSRFALLLVALSARDALGLGADACQSSDALRDSRFVLAAVSGSESRGEQLG